MDHMDIGVSLPHGGRASSADAILRIAREAEALGYASLWTWDRLLFPISPRQGYGGRMPWPAIMRRSFDPLLTLTLAATATQRIRLGVSVLDALFRAPIVASKQLATLDHFSGGRLMVGLGQGWSEEEFIATNVPMKRRGAGMEDWVEALLATWGPDPVSYQGRFYRIPESDIRPKPLQQPHPPLMLGSPSPEGLARAIRLGVGLNPFVFSRERQEEALAAFRAAAAAAGRDPDALPYVARANGPYTLDALGVQRRFMTGSPEEVATDLGELAAIGLPHVILDVNMSEMPIQGQSLYLRRLRALVPA